MRPAFFLDRDGTVTREVGYVNHTSRLELLPRAAQAIRRPDGTNRRVEVVATVRGRLSARTGEGRGALSGVGSALGMADVDADGFPELLTQRQDHPMMLPSVRSQDFGPGVRDAGHICEDGQRNNGIHASGEP